MLAGEWKLSFGEKFEAERLRTFPAGSVYRLPAGVPHFQATVVQGALIQLESTGPTRTNYLKPPDDPRKEMTSEVPCRSWLTSVEGETNLIVARALGTLQDVGKLWPNISRQMV